MNSNDLYSNAHLIVAAIRILEYRHKKPPLIEDVCKSIPFSIEQGHLLCRKLKDLGIVEMVDGAYGVRLSINDHLQIEKIDRDIKETHIKEDLEKFKESQKKFSKKIESIKAEQEKKQKDLFAELEQKLKRDLKESE